MAHKYSIGIGLNCFDARAVLLRDDGKVASQIEKKTSALGANDIIKYSFELLEDILKKTKKYKQEVGGVGLALGGIVNKKKEVIYWSQDLNSYSHISFPLKQHLEKKFSLDIVVENDANACAWAEYRVNFPKCKNLIYMFSGVGCGIIIDGNLYRGGNGVAGELFLNSERKTMCSRLGDFSFLRQWPADLGIASRAKELISRGQTSSLIKKISSTGDLNLKDIFKESKKKDKPAQEAIREGAFALGVKMAFLVNLLNPEAVVVGGLMEEAGDLFFTELSTAFRAFSLSESRQNCKVVPSPLGLHAASFGAAMLALDCK